MGDRIHLEVDMVVDSCWHEGCGQPFAMSRRFERARVRDGGSFYCPAGHKLYYGEGSAAREKRLREQAEATAKIERRKRLAAERSKNAVRGHLTRAKRRANSGTCPHCARSFKQVKEHIARMHPQHAEKGLGGPEQGP